jgi:hypothetical protein
MRGIGTASACSWLQAFVLAGGKGDPRKARPWNHPDSMCSSGLSTANQCEPDRIQEDPISPLAESVFTAPTRESEDFTVRFETRFRRGRHRPT